MDRDGVITRERTDYVKTVSEMEILPNVGRSLSRLNFLNFDFLVVTNQSVVNRRMTTTDELSRIHIAMIDSLKLEGCVIRRVYYCPHLPEENCDCRKPRPGLVLEAANDFGIDISQSWLIGDKDTDMELAKAVGCNSIKVKSNDPDSFSDAVSTIIRVEGSGGW